MTFSPIGSAAGCGLNEDYRKIIHGKIESHTERDGTSNVGVSLRAHKKNCSKRGIIKIKDNSEAIAE